jgi:hypothetical protein
LQKRRPFNIPVRRITIKSSLHIFRKVCYGAWTFIVIPL